LKKGKVKQMIYVKIVKTSSPNSWYANLIGTEFECEEFGDTYVVKEDYDGDYRRLWRHIDKSDCIARDAEQRNAPTEAGGDWVCIKCKTRNSDDKSICGFCDTPRLGG
jgi:hypothetical protein